MFERAGHLLKELLPAFKTRRFRLDRLRIGPAPQGPGQALPGSLGRLAPGDPVEGWAVALLGPVQQRRLANAPAPVDVDKLAALWPLQPQQSIQFCQFSLPVNELNYHTSL